MAKTGVGVGEVVGWEVGVEGKGDNEARGEGTGDKGIGDWGIGVGGREEEVGLEGIGVKGAGVGEKMGAEPARHEAAPKQTKDRMNRSLVQHFLFILDHFRP